jgi:hypothetical protein
VFSPFCWRPGEIVVDAKDADAAAFCKKYGFIEIPATPNRLFLPMDTIAKLFSSPPLSPSP